MVTSNSKMAAKKVDFRRLKEERESSKKKTKIDSPLAKYNNAGQLFCVLCNAPVKNELLWNAHIQSKKHKESFIALKSKKEAAPSSQNIHSQKRHTFAKPAEVDKRKNEQDAEVSESPKKKPKVSSNQTSSLPSDFFDKPTKQQPLVSHTSDDDSDDDDDEHTPSSVKPIQTSSSGLPADFFDNHKEKETTEDNTKTRKPSEELPEGFFDDPKLDAKARKIEYKDPVEQEWEKFQKEIQMENQVSEALVEEDDEVARIDRQLHELNEQSEYFLRAHELRDKQTIIKQKIEEKVAEEQKQDSSDSEDFEEFFDWRAKKAM